MAESKYSDIVLDKGRPFAAVFPPENDAHFEQDGFYFGSDAGGNKLVENDVFPLAEQRDKLERMAAERRADREAEKARQRSLEKSGFGDGSATDSNNNGGQQFVGRQTGGGASQTDQGNQSGGINLVAWARNELDKPVPFFSLAKAARDQYDYDPGNAAALAEWMVRNNKIPREEVKVVNLDGIV